MDPIEEEGAVGGAIDADVETTSAANIKALLISKQPNASQVQVLSNLFEENGKQHGCKTCGNKGADAYVLGLETISYAAQKLANGDGSCVKCSKCHQAQQNTNVVSKGL
jgi:hypothetical protein